MPLTSGSQIVPHSSLLGRALTQGQKLAQITLQIFMLLLLGFRTGFIYLSICLSIYSKDL